MITKVEENDEGLLIEYLSFDSITLQIEYSKTSLDIVVLVKRVHKEEDKLFSRDRESIFQTVDEHQSVK